MTVEVVESAKQRVRCACGALLSYGVRDVHRGTSGPRISTHPSATNGGGWPWIACPECHRAVMVSGCF